jgi:hypothetical protein
MGKKSGDYLYKGVLRVLKIVEIFGKNAVIIEAVWG